MVRSEPNEKRETSNMADFNFEEYSDVFEDTQEPIDFEALSDIFEDTGVPTEEMAFESAMKSRETSTATRSLTKEERATKFPPVVQETIATEDSKGSEVGVVGRRQSANRYSSPLVISTIGTGYASFTDTQEAIKSAQAGLTELGYVPRGIDGVLGAGTQAALRSFQEAEGLPVTGTLDANTYSKIQDFNAKRFTPSQVVNDLFSELPDIEDDVAHLGDADYTDVGITLAYGIVPTRGLQYRHNGNTIDLPESEARRWPTLQAAGVTTNNFDPANVILDNVEKDGVRRSDYRTDEEFTKATITAFEDKVKKEIRDQNVSLTDIPAGSLKGVISFAWNTGDGHEYDDIEPAYEEMAEANPDMEIIQTGMLQVFTQDGIVLRGIGARRAIDYNMVAESKSQPTISAYTPKHLANGKAGFEYELSDGSTFEIDTGKDYATKTSFRDFKFWLNTRVEI
jgi:peptidoglycan hydrolase-like protein with peptidoglycan-binding domain